MQDLLLDTDNDLLIDNGDLAVGNSLVQEVGLLLLLHQGELKSDPIMGPNLTLNIRGGDSKDRAIVKAKLHLARDGKNYDDVKNEIRLDGRAY